MQYDDNRRPMMTLGMLMVIALAFAAGRMTVGHLAPNPKHEEAVAIQAYREGDTGDALPLFKQLAGKGDPTAAYYLGEMYQYGDGTPRDGAQAVKWFTQSAKAGHVPAARQLGLVYLNGTDQVQDLAAARKWLGMAARHHDPMALRHLGDMNAHGLGAPADPVAAYADYAAAAVLGNTYAGNLRDELATRLSTDQQAAGQKQADTLVAGAAPNATAATTATPAGKPPTSSSQAS
jgi:TPR repeat protein